MNESEYDDTDMSADEFEQRISDSIPAARMGRPSSFPDPQDHRLSESNKASSFRLRQESPWVPQERAIRF